MMPVRSGAMAIQQFPVSGSVRSRSGLALVMDGTLRIGPLIPIPQLLREMTVDPIDVMREAGIDPQDEHLYDASRSPPPGGGPTPSGSRTGW